MEVKIELNNLKVEPYSKSENSRIQKPSLSGATTPPL